MTEPTSTTATSAAPSNPGPSAGPAPASAPAQNTPPAVNDRSRGHSPALDAREQQVEQQQPGGAKIKLGDQEFAEQELRDALGFKAEHEVRKANLPQSPDGYEVALPSDFKAPEGVKFEFDMNDPVLAQARQLAHARGLDQETFSSLLSLYAADKIGTQMQLANARNAEIQKLGTAASARINGLETWLKARVGSDADVLVNQMRAFPHAGMVRAFEKIVASFSNQGAVDFSQSGRVQEEAKGRIPGFENMDFKQQRVAQMQRMPPPPRETR